MYRKAVTIIILSASTALAGLAPRQDFTSDCSQAPVKRTLTFVQGSSQDIGWTFKQGATAKDISSATAVVFSFAPSTRAWAQSITGALDTVTGTGSVLIVCTPTQINTNTATTGPLDWILSVSSSTTTLAYAYGKLNLVADPNASTNAFVPVSPNASQAWVLGLGYSADALTNLTAGSGISITGSGATRTIAATNGVQGTLNGTNGVYWVTGSTTNWLLF